MGAMSDSTRTMTRYLLGELSEGEQSAFEAAYFDDPRLVTEVAEAEDALIDDYVRGRLSPDVRRRFERVYLGDAQRRERVDFARALVVRLDGDEPSDQLARAADRSLAAPGWLVSIFGAAPVLRWSLAVGLLVIASGVLWFSLPSSRVPNVAGPAPVAPVDSRASSAPDVPVAPAAPSATVILALNAGLGVRSGRADGPVSLVIPAGASAVRLDLSLDDPDHNRFAVTLRKVGGAEIFRRDNLRPASTGPAFSLLLPAETLVAGDYLLTLSGAQGNDALEDLSQTLIKVDRPR
jgi:hypothetical protein